MESPDLASACDLTTNQAISRWYSFVLLIVSSLLIIIMLLKSVIHIWNRFKGKSDYSSLERSDIDSYRATP